MNAIKTRRPYKRLKRFFAIPSIRNYALIGLLLWTILVTFATAGLFFGRFFVAARIVRLIVILIALIPVYCSAVEKPKIAKDTLWHRMRTHLGLVSAIVAFPLLVVASMHMMDILKEVSIQRYLVEHQAFKESRDGYEFIDRYAMENYGIPILLESPRASWALTELAIPSSSPASMSEGWNYCSLLFNQNSLDRQMGSPFSELKVEWSQGIQIHELGHCLDRSRDLNGESGTQELARSIAPKERIKVKNLKTFVEAEDSLQTTHWREILADVFVVGYWRMSASEASGSLIAGLQSWRDKAKNSDPTHFSNCWTEIARQAPMPNDAKQLFKWADDIREKSKCPLLTESKG
jgi:hypothetical protein